jgi:polyisoprenoid-binding protein YceI
MATENWNIDTSHSTADFVVRHMVVSKVRGTFHKWSGAIQLDTEDFSKSKVSAKFEVGSIDTRDAQRDGHLKSADFFDVEKHPEMTFTSTKVTGNPEKFDVTGPLTIRGTTHEVTLHVEGLGTGKDPWGNTRNGYSAKTSISRKDFGMTWSQALETGGVLVGDKIEIELEIQAVQAK